MNIKQLTFECNNLLFALCLNIHYQKFNLNLNSNPNEIIWYYLIFKFLSLCITKLLSLSSESTLLHFAFSC